MIIKQYIILLITVINISIFSFNIFASNQSSKTEFVNSIKIKKSISSEQLQKSQNQSSKVEFNDPANTITVKKSQPTFDIILKSNPTTGYKWVLKSYDNSILNPITQGSYAVSDKKLIGSSGYEKWTFRIKNSGFVVSHITNISLAYMRPWGAQDFQTTTFKVMTQNDD